jgi:hypothetical protein
MGSERNGSVQCKAPRAPVRGNLECPRSYDVNEPLSSEPLELTYPAGFTTFRLTKYHSQKPRSERPAE